MKRNSLIFGAALCCHAMPLYATSILEDVVVTANRQDQLVSEVGTNISLIDDIEDIQAVHINETMQRISGVWISRGNGQENLTAIRSPVLTGAGGCGAFLTAQDGIPLRASGFCNVNELFDVNAEQAGRIEVIKGPGTAFYGSNAMHGMINVITPEVTQKQQYSVEAGPHNYYRAKTTLGGNSWQLDLNGVSDGGYKDDSGFDQQKLNLKHRGELGGFDARTVFSFSNLNQETAGFVVGDRVYEDNQFKRQNPNPEAYRDARSFRLYSTLNKTLASGANVTVKPYLRSNEMEFIQHFLPGQAIEENGHDSIGVQTAWQQNSLTLGFDAELTQGYLKEYQPQATSGSAFLVATIPAGAHYDYEVDASTLALFAQYSLELSEATQINFGGRLEQVRYDYDNKMLDGRTRDDGTACGFGGCRFSRPADRKDTFNNFSPTVTLTHMLGEQQQIYSHLARGYRAPQATELYRLQGSQSVADIDSEELDSFEIGLRGNLNDWGYDIAAYVMKKDNFIFRDTNRANIDNGETSHQGLEVTLNRAWTDTLSSDLVYSFAKHRYENNPALVTTPIEGNDIDTAPRHQGSMRVRWQPISRFHSELEWIYLGTYFVDPENQNTYKGHHLVNLRLNWQINESLTTFARWMNVGNVDYAERADYAFGNYRYFVGEPTAIYVGVTHRFR